VIIGGIGGTATAPIALSDVHILNLTTLQWSSAGPDTKKSPDLLLSGAGPVRGIYGHAAFAIRRAVTNVNFGASAGGGGGGGATSKANGRGIENDRGRGVGKGVDYDEENEIVHDIITFGGSSNVISHTANCYTHLFRLDMVDHTWHNVETGYLYPSGRINHSVAIVRGASHQHLLPQFDGNGHNRKVTQGEVVAERRENVKLRNSFSRSAGIKFTNPMVGFTYIVAYGV
jgi:hypothetical protein